VAIHWIYIIQNTTNGRVGFACAGPLAQEHRKRAEQKAHKPVRERSDRNQCITPNRSSDHFEHPRNVGELPVAGTPRRSLEHPVCGDIMSLGRQNGGMGALTSALSHAWLRGLDRRGSCPDILIPGKVPGMKASDAGTRAPC